MKVMLTGFNPFGGESVNPAYEAVKLVPDQVAGAEIVRVEIPTEFGRAGEVLDAAIAANKPDIVICVGQAGGRSAMTVERVAINLADGRIPDNAGYQPVDKVIREDGKNAYFASVPVKAMVEKMHESGIPAFVSYTAGTYVCNFLMYELLYLLDTKYTGLRGGFIHVPFATEQAVNKANGMASMDIPVIAKALACAVEAAVAGVESSKNHGTEC